MPDVTLTRRHALLVALALLAVLAVAGTRLVRAGAAEPPRRPAAAAPLEAAAPAVPARVVVHVVGAVRRPGLYRLAEGSRVADAVDRAGGPTRRAELAAVNLAAPIVDGAQVVVPARAVSAATGAAPVAGPLAAPPGPLSLATATAAQLDELPGVGPVTAERIVAWRTAHGPFRSVDDLDDVPGIGPTRVEQLRELVVP